MFLPLKSIKTLSLRCNQLSEFDYEVLMDLISLETLDLFGNSSLFIEDVRRVFDVLKKLKKLNVWQTETNCLPFQTDDIDFLIEVTTQLSSNMFSKDVSYVSYRSGGSHSFLFHIVDYQEEFTVGDDEISLTGYLYANKLFAKKIENEWIYKKKLLFKAEEIDVALIRVNFNSGNLFLFCREIKARITLI
jgi:hypothetical protein